MELVHCQISFFIIIIIMEYVYINKIGKKFS